MVKTGNKALGIFLPLISRLVIINNTKNKYLFHEQTFALVLDDGDLEITLSIAFSMVLYLKILWSKISRS